MAQTIETNLPDSESWPEYAGLSDDELLRAIRRHEARFRQHSVPLERDHRRYLSREKLERLAELATLYLRPRTVAGDY